MPINPDIFEKLFPEIAKLLISGIIGGFIGAFLHQRTFRWETRFQAKYQDKLKKRDNLRDILVILPIVFRNIQEGWKVSGDDAEEGMKFINELRQKIGYTKTLFIDDERIRRKLNLLNSLLGARSADLTRSGVEPPSQMIADIEDVINNAIRELNDELYTNVK